MRSVDSGGHSIEWKFNLDELMWAIVTVLVDLFRFNFKKYFTSKYNNNNKRRERRSQRAIHVECHASASSTQNAIVRPFTPSCLLVGSLACLYLFSFRFARHRNVFKQHNIDIVDLLLVHFQIRNGKSSASASWTSSSTKRDFPEAKKKSFPIIPFDGNCVANLLLNERDRCVGGSRKASSSQNATETASRIQAVNISQTTLCMASSESKTAKTQHWKTKKKKPTKTHSSLDGDASKWQIRRNCGKNYRIRN